jgi:hypothetical protein
MFGVKATLKRALTANHDTFCTRIAGLEKGRITGLEAAFAQAFESQLPASTIIERRVPPSIIKSRSYPSSRVAKWFDCYLSATSCALEYKVMRIPRRVHSGVGGARYDVSQLTDAYLRLRHAGHLAHGYLVVFVYGPVVAETATIGGLYRAFHNQLYLDLSVAKETSQLSLKTEGLAFRELGWDCAWGAASVPKGVSVTKEQSLAAVCIDCRA